MKTKNLYKLAVSLLLAVAMLAMPVGAAFFNGGNSVTVKASDGVEESTEENAEPEESTEPEGSSETDPTEDSTEPPTETVSGNDAEEVKCICTDKCSTYQVNTECSICKEDSSQCAYVAPNVKISINIPNGWYKDKAELTFKVEDTKNTGNFKVKSFEVRVSQNGSWTDITDEMSFDISENCSIYVQVTDQNGKTYTKNKYVECFDKVKPTLNAAINDGLLSIQGIDNDSGIKAVYVNGYEFTELTNGVLNIRLQQFDAGYQYFTLQAVDNAGNMSEVYKTANPYYEDPTVEKDSSDTSKSPASQLPVSAAPSAPTDAKGTVTDYTSTSGTSKDTATGDSTASNTGSDMSATAEGGKEFYTITTKSDKVFYLIVDKDSIENNVYLLTEVGENDLLNFTETDSETLPQNSAVTESALPSTQAENKKTDTVDTEDTDSTEIEESTEESEKVTKPTQSSNAGTYMIMAIALFGVGAVVYYTKVVKGKKESFDDDYDEEDEEEAKYESEEESGETEDDTVDQESEAEENAESFEDEDDYM